MERTGQAVIVALALALWAAYAEASLTSLALAYGVAWLGVNAVLVLRPRALELTRGQAIALAALVALPSLAEGARLYRRLAENEGLDELGSLLEARMRLEITPSIAPPLVAADRPQTFYVHAPDAREVRVRFGAGAPRLSTRALGQGLFRLEYDPRTHGPPDPPDGEVRASIEVDGAAHTRRMTSVTPLAHPRALAVSPDRRRIAAVSEETDELVVVDTRGTARLRVDVGDGPTDVRFVDDETLVVAHRYDDALVWVSAIDGEILRRRRVGPSGLHLAVGHGRIALAQGGTTPRVRTLHGGAQADIETGFPPDHVAFGPDADTLVVSSVRPPALHRFRRDGSRWNEDRPPLWLGRPAVTLAPSPDGARVVVAVTDYAPDGPPHLGNHFVQDQLVTVDVATWAVVETRLTARRTSQQDRAGNLDRGVSPMALAFAADGALLVAFAGTDDVWHIATDAADVAIHPLEAHPLASPHGVAPLADGGFAVSSPVDGTIGLFGADGSPRELVRLAPSDGELRQRDLRALERRIGERTFYESTRAGISCQSCHLHGGSDGALHNIGGSTLVATLDTRGLLGTPPYLRDGGYPRLGSLHDLSTTLYRGFRRRQAGRRVGLERHLEAQPRPTPPRQLEGRDEARERRGLEVFVRARCPLCHAFPAFTNLGQHPIASVFPDATGADHEVDTPSLLGLGESAPYLLDGRAETLEEVFRQHDAAARHGDTAALSDAELADLVHLLEGL